ncbi:alpha/beta hydrolase [Bailinhaonella thermotolerans]|uniref:Alpha/beta hydrolase n=2 Tax=Bailinhaonella thermotolerans TaxID=1070861 RepID=A0A3A4A006_9ACTN|nr:alpha/beta hydrolase [Bailinhaonella thermotolerans]
MIPGPGGELRVRVYTPAAATPPLPALLYFHGGGFVAGGVDTHDAWTAWIADEVGTVVISVDYRLAPENPFPAAPEDAYAALEWTAAHAAELGVDPARIAAGGDSAGGNLAAVLALLTRDRGGPPLRFQYLDVPVTDDRMGTPSMRAFDDTPVWNRPANELMWRHYLGDGVRPGGPGVSPYAAPIRAADLSGLPPAFVATAEYDPLRDEGIEYAGRLLAAGVHTELRVYPRVPHGVVLLGGGFPVVRRIAEDHFAALRRALLP